MSFSTMTIRARAQYIRLNRRSKLRLPVMVYLSFLDVPSTADIPKLLSGYHHASRFLSERQIRVRMTIYRDC